MSLKETINGRIKYFLLIIAGSVFFLLQAFINHYPIVYSDTSTYLISGFELEAPFDRPITYGLFIWLSSLNGLSLWLVIFAQSAILSFILFELVKLILPQKSKQGFLFIITILFISIFTGVSWFSSQLIPDVFTPILILSLLLLIAGKQSAIKTSILYFLVALSTSMHISHISFNIVFFILLFIMSRIKRFKNKILLKPLYICILITVASIFTMGSALDKSKHVFLMGAFIEQGIIKQYLDENCEEKKYELCLYKDSLPSKAWVFVWDKNSPLYKMGGWKSTKEEYSDIINETFTSPKYILIHIKESVKATMKQLVTFKAGDGNGVFIEGTHLFKSIGLYVKHEQDNYKLSKQNQGKLSFLLWYNKTLTIILTLSILVLVPVLFVSTEKFKMLFLILLLGIVLNSWVCGTFANVIDRFGLRVIWFIPLMAFMGGLVYWDEIRNKLHLKYMKKK